MLTDIEAAYLAGIIDGEGTITLTKNHRSENRRPLISIASTDLELLIYIKDLIGGTITKKKNYNPSLHRDSFVFTLKNKQSVMLILRDILPYLRIEQKKSRALFLLSFYDSVTSRNGKYTTEQQIQKQNFENEFFSL